MHLDDDRPPLRCCSCNGCRGPGLARYDGAGGVGRAGSEEGSLSQYVEQLAAVRAHLLNGESEAVYRTMNRFMEMLQAREAGISAEAADRLFDYCYLVTPPRYHDVSRHLHRLS